LCFDWNISEVTKYSSYFLCILFLTTVIGFFPQCRHKSCVMCIDVSFKKRQTQWQLHFIYYSTFWQLSVWGLIFSGIWCPVSGWMIQRILKALYFCETSGAPHAAAWCHLPEHMDQQYFNWIIASISWVHLLLDLFSLISMFYSCSETLKFVTLANDSSCTPMIIVLPLIMVSYHIGIQLMQKYPSPLPECFSVIVSSTILIFISPCIFRYIP
jgi:hypothetical protein